MENILIYILIGFIIYAIIGYFLWSYTLDTYSYNIFNIPNIIRGIVSVYILFLNPNAIVLLNTPFFIVLALWLWTFIATMKNTNVFIAVLAVIYQLIASILVISLINRLIKYFNGQ